MMKPTWVGIGPSRSMDAMYPLYRAYSQSHRGDKNDSSRMLSYAVDGYRGVA